MIQITPEMIGMMAKCQAMIEVLAENRLLAQEIFKAMPEECFEKFEESVDRILKYMKDLED